MREIESHQVKEIFGPDYGVGIKFTVPAKAKNEHSLRGEHWWDLTEYQGEYITYWAPRQEEVDKRKIKLEINSWTFCGSLGAVHFYCTLKDWRGCQARNTRTGEDLKSSSALDCVTPDEMKSLCIKVMRKVDKRDIDHAKKQNDFYIPQRGGWTHGFWTEKEACEAGIKFFKKWFKGWILEGRNQEGDLITLAET